MNEMVVKSEAPWYRRYGWAIPFALGALLGLFGLGVIFMGTDPNDFGSSTGIAWEAFNSASPKVAQYLNRVERLLGAITFGFGAWAAVVAYVYLKRGDRMAWRAMWLMPITLPMTAAVFFVEEASGLGGFYVGAVAIALLGQVLSYPSR